MKTGKTPTTENKKEGSVKQATILKDKYPGINQLPVLEHRATVLIDWVKQRFEVVMN